MLYMYTIQIYTVYIHVNTGLAVWGEQSLAHASVNLLILTQNVSGVGNMAVWVIC